jgi:MerR family transcriptional regulator, light-induced transcriptional regulator
MMTEDYRQHRGFAHDREYVSTQESSRTTVESIAAAYRAAALDGDRSEALRIIREDGLAAGLSVSQLYLGVIQSTQYEIGRLWEEGDITISQEHLATAISQLAIAQLYSLMPRRNSAGMRVLIACVPGETHDMGPRILADFFEMDGFDVRYLGADVPTREIVEAVEHSRPDIIALSATMSYNLPAFQQTVIALRERFGEDVLIAAGGQAFQLTPELLDELNIPIRAADARQLVDQSRTALGIT